MSISRGHGVSKPIYQKYLGENGDFEQKWRQFAGIADKSLSEADYRAELTPFYGMPEFENFTDHTKKKLFFEYIKFIAEAQILLEQVLIYGFWYFKKRITHLDPEVQQSLGKIACEELYHSDAYRDFLADQKVFDWPAQRVFPRHRPIRKLLALIIKNAPLGMTLPGAKIEAFSMAYNRMLKDVYMNHDANSWTILNHYHHIDEAFHVPLEFDLYNSTIETAGPLRSLFSTLFFILFLQYTLVTGSWSVVRTCFSEMNRVQRFFWTLKLAKWAVRYMPAYKETLKITRKQFDLKKPKYSKILSFMHF